MSANSIKVFNYVISYMSSVKISSFLHFYFVVVIATKRYCDRPGESCGDVRALSSRFGVDVRYYQESDFAVFSGLVGDIFVVFGR